MTTDDNVPDWDKPMTISVTPGDLIHALFTTASDVHTGWSSCIDNALITSDLTALDDRSGNYARLAEQEFSDEESPDILWHDWTVEIQLAEVLVTAHWAIQVTAPPLDWDWCAREAEKAFEKAAVIVGKRVRRSVVVEENPDAPPPPDRRHH